MVAGKVDVLDLPLKSQEAPDFLINALVLRPHGFKLPTPKAIIHMLPRIWNLTKGLTIKTVPQVPDLYLCLFDEEAVRDKSSSWGMAWSINGSHLSLQKWSPDIPIESLTFDYALF